VTSLPPPGTFRLYPYAYPPLAAGVYTLTGEVDGLPGAVEPLQAAIDITAPRFALPPDQVLSTFPPASARGAFTSRLPQVVIRRRTVPWERSAFAADGTLLTSLTPQQRRTTTPRPWLALVLIAEGEANLLTDVPVSDCTTAGTALADPADTDVPKGACLEIPQSVVTKVFPALEDLPNLVHVREVDLADTELAMGDDDGWMAVVLANRLPQADTAYTACLINLEGQYGTLPVHPPVAPDYNPKAAVYDRAVLNDAIVQYRGSSDARAMGTTTTLTSGPAAVATNAVTTNAAVGKLSAAGSGWSSTLSTASPASAGLVHATTDAASVNLAALETGISVYLPWHLVEPTYRFPVLLSWSFYCTDSGDFQYLAQNVNSRLLGHLASGPETPDGEPLPPGGLPAGLPAEPPSARPLPLVTATGHVATAHETRLGTATAAWFRGALVPTPVDRVGPRPDGRYPLAHHADQLRRVSPDGREDLSYAAAFEIGRLLALSQPSVVAALNQWRRQHFAAATTAALAEHLAAVAPAVLGDLFRRVDPLVDRPWTVPDGLPGPPPPADPRAAAGVGRRFVRGLLSALGEQPTDLAPARPLADPGFAVDRPAAVFDTARDARLTAGLALPQAAEAASGDLADRLWGAPVTTASRDPGADRAAARADLEELAGGLADAGRSVRERGPSR
jgi:hypothetical protein